MNIQTPPEWYELLRRQLPVPREVALQEPTRQPGDRVRLGMMSDRTAEALALEMRELLEQRGFEAEVRESSTDLAAPKFVSRQRIDFQGHGVFGMFAAADLNPGHQRRMGWMLRTQAEIHVSESPLNL